MNKTPRLSKSGIEYLDYVWDFYSGCLNKRSGTCLVQNCWAESITKRMGHNYPNGFEPTFYPESFCSPLHLKKPSIIGCAFMGDLFGDWVNPEMKIHTEMPSGKASATMSLKSWIFTTIRLCPQHRFLFLTKCLQNLVKWGHFPGNCWVGVTVTQKDKLIPALDALDSIQCSIRYLSIEPMLGRFDIPDLDILLGGTVNQVIIGAQTKPYKPPKWEWVSEIIEACVKADIPYFLKKNLELVVPKVFGGDDNLIQEMPK